MAERFEQLRLRLAEYDLLPVAFELLVLWIIFYAVYRFVRGTRAAGALKGLLFVLVIATLVLRVFAEGVFPRLAVLYDNFLSIATIILIVTFQPELRRALIRLGETPFFRAPRADMSEVIDAVADSAVFLSKNNFGAIVAIQRRVGLRELIESGRTLNSDVSAHLLQTIFWPNSPLHDMGVIIQDGRIAAAGVQFPLAQAGEMPDQHLGTRHRAALGLAKVTDALIVVVSEETGSISIAEHGRLTRHVPPADLRDILALKLDSSSVDEEIALEPIEPEAPAKAKREEGKADA